MGLMGATAAVWLLLALGGCQNQQQLPQEALSWSKPQQHSDPFELTEVHVKRDELVATVVYGGGCATHHFELVPSGPLIRSLPPKQPLALVHDGQGDECEALLETTLSFDLAPFRASPRGVTVLLIADTALMYRYD